jgi:hypothetical protein
MKMICINNKPLPTTPDEYLSDLNLIKEGDTYIVTWVLPSDGYLLKDVNCNNPAGFNPTRFVEISDIDELELVNQKEEYVNSTR